jgi:hypothetical protein
MQHEDRWKDGLNAPLIAGLVGADARFLVIGGTAVWHYCRERFPRDLDLLLDNTPEAARVIHDALTALGIPVELAGLMQPRRVLKLSDSRTEADLFTPLDDESFRGLWDASEAALIGGHSVRVLGLNDLIARQSNLPPDVPPEDVAKAVADCDLLEAVAAARSQSVEGPGN